MSNELNPYVRALVIQLINDNIAEGKEEFPLVIPVDYKERVYNQRELVKKLISSLGYLYSESGLPDDWANGWELTSNRHLQDPTDIIPDDMLIEGKNRIFFKQGTESNLTYKLWVKVSPEPVETTTSTTIL